MNSDLPATGTIALLQLLAPFVPDDFINQCWPHGPTGGRHREHPAAQLVRVHRLSLLSPVHSLNLLVKMLPGCGGRTACPTCAGCTSFGRVWASPGGGKSISLSSTPASITMLGGSVRWG